LNAPTYLRKKETELPRRYLIVGTGAAGIAAVEAIRSQDSSGEIVLIGQEAHGFYSRPGLAYYLADEIPEHQLYPFTQEDLERLNVRQLHARATQLNQKEHRAVLDDGARLHYDRLLIATGSRAFMPPLPGIDLDGVVKLDTLDDARQIVKRSRRTRTAVVVGGGITALELVEGLRARRVKTHYFLRRDRYWSSVLDETESRIVEHRLKKEGVQIHYHTELAEILGKRGRVIGVRTKNGHQIKCHIVAVAIGVRPQKELAEGTDLETDRGILVNEYLQTNDPDLFAAGDVAQVFDPFSGRAILDTLWSTAVAQGRAAGLNMAGKAIPYRKSVPFNVTRLAGLTTTIIGTVGGGRDEDVLGIVRGDSETWRQLPDAIAVQDSFEVNRLRILVGKQRLLGAIVMGDQTLSQPLHRLVAGRADVTPIHDQLLRPNAPIADLVADFWIRWRQQHASPQL
jgi:NADPH-dependent 2,4-dienoyl-CoA reductase/sulfur reductase-like enzyme